MVLTLMRGKSTSADTKLLKANPDLRPERLDTYEVGADYAPLPGLKISPSLFYSKGWDFIYSVDSGQTATVAGYLPNRHIYQNQNVSSVDIYGAEAEATYASGPATLSAAYTFNRSRIKKCSQNPYLNGNYLANAPQNQAGVTAGWRFPWLDASASWRYKGGQFYDDANTQTINPYSTLAFKVLRRLGAGVTIAAAMENALNKRYQESPPPGTPNTTPDLAPGRMGKASLAWEF